MTRPLTARVTELADATAAPSSDLRRVLRHRPFRRLWVNICVSSLGDWLGLLAQTALASSLAHTQRSQVFAVGGVLVVRFIPALLLGPFAGAFADRFDRRLTMVVCDLARMALIASIPVVGTLTYLYTASFFVECFALFWIPAKEASVPNLLAPEELESANTLNLLATYGTGAVAAGVFALLSLLNRLLAAGIPFFHTNPVDLSLYFDALTFAFSAVTIYLLREIRGVASRTGAAGPGPVGFLRSIVDGWRFVGSTPLIRGLCIGILGAFTAAGTVMALGRPFVGLLHAGNAAYGLLFGAVFVGLAAGMVLGPRLPQGLRRRRLFGPCIVAAGAALVVVSVAPDLVLALFVVLLVAGFAGVAWVTGYTLLGLEVADEVRGRTFSFVQSMVQVNLLAVLAVAPFVAGAIGRHSIRLPNHATIRADGITIVLLVGGLVAIASGVASYRQMDDHRGGPLLADLWNGLRNRAVAPVYPGLLIALEGGEGVGKSTQAQLLAQLLGRRGLSVLVTREPGDTPAGERIRGLLLDPATVLTPRAEALLYAADRAQHVQQVVTPALRRGAVVITDRYVDSSLAYQSGGRELPFAEVARLSELATGGLVADLTVLLDLDPVEGLRRCGRTDRLEQESLEFHQRVREVFLALAARRPSRYAVVCASGSPDEVHAQVAAAVQRLLPLGTAVPAPAPVPR